MKLFAATERGQGLRRGDYHHCVEGELVMFPLLMCALDERHRDGGCGCGCGRGWAGVASRRATTTATVVDLDCDRDQLVESFRDRLRDSGWPGYVVECADDLAEEITEMAARFPAGIVLERRLDRVRVRLVEKPLEESVHDAAGTSANAAGTLADNFVANAVHDWVDDSAGFVERGGMTGGLPERP